MMRRSNVTVAALCGSLRRGSLNLALLRAARELVPPRMTIAIMPIGTLPFFNSDIARADEPESVATLKRAIGACDALLIATPEYNSGIPGVLKNAIDWASQPLDESVLAGKPTAVMGCTTGHSGTIRAQLQLRQTLQYTQAHALPAPELLVSHAHSKFDAAGRLTDAQTLEAVKRVLLQLREWTLRLQRAGLAVPGSGTSLTTDRMPMERLGGGHRVSTPARLTAGSLSARRV